jgi:uncharacterized protein (TIGR03000 family)
MKVSVSKFALSLLTSATVLFACSSAQAGWGSLGGSYGGSYGGGSYGSSGYAVSYGSYGGSYGSVGRPFTPVRSVLRGIHNHIAAKVERHQARRAAYASYGSVGYGSSGYGSSGYEVHYGSSGGYSYGSSGHDVSYGSTGSVSYGSVGSVSHGESYGSVGSTVYHGPSASAETGYDLVSNVEHAEDAVYLTVSVPGSTNLYVNGKLTTSTGSVRQFVSRGLVAGKSYKFDIRAELQSADGQTLTEQRSVVVTAGAREQLQIAFAESNVPVETTLTVNVPEGANVSLAGNPTKATGTQRSYQSNQLKAGEVWDKYEVQVELDGKIKRQEVRLIGGDSLELSFNFDEQAVDQIASNR